jgi:hypothetical protein
MLDDLRFYMNTALHSRKIMRQNNIKVTVYVQNKSYIGISFNFLVFGIYGSKIISEYKTMKLYRERLDLVTGGK